MARDLNEMERYVLEEHVEDFKDGLIVQEKDPRIVAGKADVKAADSTTLIGYFSRPSAAGKFPGIVVVHENRGITEHIRDVTRRFATAGFAAVAIDILSRAGGADKLSDAAAYSAELAKRALPDQVADEKAALDFLKTQAQVDAMPSTTTPATGSCRSRPASPGSTRSSGSGSTCKSAVGDSQQRGHSRLARWSDLLFLVADSLGTLLGSVGLAAHLP